MFKIPVKTLIAAYFLLCQSLVLLGQKPCNCAFYDQVKDETDNHIYTDLKDDKTVNLLITSLSNMSEIACKAHAFVFQANLFFNQKQWDSTTYYLSKSEDILLKNTCNDAAFYAVFILKLKLFYQKQDYNEAIKYGYKALEIAENERNDDKQAETLAHISRIFSRMQQYDKMMEYTRRAYTFIQALPPSVKKAILLEYLAQNYNTQFQIRVNQLYFLIKNQPVEQAANTARQQAIEEGLLDTIRLLTRSCMQLAQQYKHTPTLIKGYRHLQTVEMNLNNDDKALMYIDSSLMYSKISNDYSGLFIGFGDKADVYFKEKNSVLAAQFADSCLFYAKLLGTPLSIANAYYTVSDIAELAGNWKKAFYALREVKVIMDSVQNLERTTVVNELEKKYNQAKNEKTIKELAQEKRIYLLLALAALLGIIIFLFYMRQQTLKNKQKILETEQRLNRARMNPHFFFNALTSLQSFALRENDGKTLAINLSKFSHIMRETLESTYKEYVTIEQEMAFLNEYLEIQKIRFPKKFGYTIEADDAVEIDELLIPSMIIQPFVENSIEHGFAGLEHEGRVNVFFNKINNEVLIEIKDNGRGLGQSNKTNEHISRASQIIKDRIYLLNSKLKTKARFSIDNQTDSSGVIVRIFLPIIYQNENT